MKTNNQYWGLGYVELEELHYEQHILQRDAIQRKQFATAARFENEVKLIHEAMEQYGRGDNK